MTNDIPTNTKRCSRCKEVKLRNEFYKARKFKDGLSYVCKTCSSEYARQYNAMHPEKNRDRAHAWEKSNTDKALARRRKRYAEHPEVRATKIAINTKWNSENPEILFLSAKKWRKLNPDKCAELRLSRRTMLHKNGGVLTAKEITKIKEFYDFTCLCCERKEPEVKITLDHVIPIKLGGENSINNIQLLCQSCNSKKHTKTTDYRKFLIPENL